jgi:hypothetical protein
VGWFGVPALSGWLLTGRKEKTVLITALISVLSPGIRRQLCPTDVAAAMSTLCGMTPP